MIEQVSATQVDAFRRCARYWSFRYVHKMKTPSTPAQERGSNIHKAIENWLKLDQIEPQWAAYVDAARKHIPEGPRVVEQKIELDTYTGGPHWIGYIDLMVENDPFKILDYKTTSDFRYSKTPEELKTNLQMATYAWWLFSQMNHEWHEEYVEVGHIYLLTKTKIPQSKYVGALVTEETVRPVWEGALDTVREMVSAEGVRTEDLPPTTTSCDMYGGCPYRSNCGLGPKDFFKKGAFAMSTAPTKPSFMDRLNAAHANGTPPQPFPLQVASTQLPTPAPLAGLPPIVGVEAQARAAANGYELPFGAGFAATAADHPTPLVGALLAPDATPRAEIIPPPPVEAAQEAAQEPKKGRGRPRKAADPAPAQEAASGPLPGQLPLPTFTPAATPGGNPELTLYLDCIPTKGSGQHVLFEDFVAPIAQYVADQAGVTNYALIPYGGGKALLQDAIRASIGQVPPVLVIHSMSAGAREALDVLKPYAKRVVESLRG